MPLIKNEQVGENSHLYVWKIEELLSYFELYVDAPTDIAHPKKVLEYTVGRFMLSQYVPSFKIENLQVSDTGKPYLEHSDVEFSLSHSFPFVALLISDEAVGVDIQVYSDKIMRIAPKYTSEAEADMSDVTQLTVVWCLKEAAFKWYELGNVEFLSQIKLPKIDFSQKEQTIHFITFEGQEYFLNSRYEITDDYVIAYSWSQGA